MNKENCALKLVDEIILYYDARSKKHQITNIPYPQLPVQNLMSYTCPRTSPVGHLLS